MAKYSLLAQDKIDIMLQVQNQLKSGDPAATLPRDKWDSFDPNLISEGLFATANIFSSLKLVNLFTINPHLGPLQISLGRMISDIIKFAMYVLLVVFAYGCGFNQLYWYYAEENGKECDICTANCTLAGTDCSSCADECNRNLSK